MAGRTFSRGTCVNIISNVRHFLQEHIRINRRFLLLIVSAISGIIVSLLATSLASFIEYITEHTYKNEQLDGLRFFVPIIGGLLCGLTVYFFKKNREQKAGVEDTIKYMRFKRDTVRFRDLVIRFFTSAITLGTGGSAGKEAPVVHIGGTVGALLGKYLKFPDMYIKTLAGAGVAAAIASAFQAPIAGSFFALEILLANFTLDTFSMIVVAAVTSTAVAQKLGHLTTHISSTTNVLSDPTNLIFLALIGVLGGLTNIVFIYNLSAWESIFKKIKITPWIKPAIGGLLLAIIFLYFPALYGEGYNIINLLLKGNFNDLARFAPVFMQNQIILTLLSLLFLKIFVTAITLGSGMSGGSIVPALYIGTTLGALTSAVANHLIPNVHIAHSTWVLVGMSSILAPMTQAPIFSIMLFFELTKSYEVIMPVLIVVSVSILLSRHFMHGSLYSFNLHKEGIRMYRGMEQSVMETYHVKEIMHKDINLINWNVSLTSILNGFLHTRFVSGFVVDDNKKFIGVVTLERIKQYIKNKPLCDLLLAREIVNSSDLWVLADYTLLQALELMDKTDDSFLPVIDNANSMKAIGFITRRDIIGVYNRTVLKRGAQNILIDKDGKSSMDNYLQIGDDFQIETIKVPKKWLNKSLKDLDLRVKYSLTVIGIKKDEDLSYIMPDINYKFHNGDNITFVGKHSDIEKLHNEESKHTGLIDLIKDKWK